MVLTKEILIAITMATLGSPVFGNTAEEPVNKKQQMEFLSFLAFIGSVTEMESAGIDVDQLLADPSKKTPKSPVLPFKEVETNE